MNDWKDALRTKAAARSLQGPNAAGTPGMGAGNVPFARGAAQWKPNQEPPRQYRAASGPQLPQGAGNGAQGSPNTPQGSSPVSGPPGAPQGQMGVDPQEVMRFAQQLMDRYRVGYGQARRYRG